MADNTKLQAEISQGKPLKHAETQDKSAPVIDKDAHIGKNPMTSVMSQIVAEQPSLKKVDPTEVNDRSTPATEGAKIGEAPMKSVLAEVASGSTVIAHKKINKEIAGGEHDLKHAEIAHDGSKPQIEKDVKLREAPQKAVFAEIGKDHALKHVETAHDASAPKIEKDVKIGEAPMKAVLAEVTSGSTVMAHKQLTKEIAGGEHELKHAEIAHDGSKPQIEKDLKLREAPQKAVFADISKEHALKHVETAHDASAPKIEKDVKIGEAPMKAVLAEVVAGSQVIAHKQLNKEIAGGEHELKHAEIAHDGSKPQIEKDVKLREAPQKAVFADLSKEHALKHAEIAHDASAPKIEKDAKIGEAPQKKVFEEIAAKKADH